jgi:hypothetical protein
MAGGTQEEAEFAATMAVLGERETRKQAAAAQLADAEAREEAAVRDDGVTAAMEVEANRIADEVAGELHLQAKSTVGIAAGQAALEVLTDGGTEAEAADAAGDAAMEEEEREAAASESIASEVAGELRLDTGSKIGSVAKAAALGVLASGGTEQEAVDEARAEAEDEESQQMATAQVIATEVAGELHVDAESVVGATAQDAALKVLESGGTEQEAVGAAEQEAEDEQEREVSAAEDVAEDVAERLGVETTSKVSEW